MLYKRSFFESLADLDISSLAEQWKCLFWQSEYRVRINYRRISLRHNLSRKCRQIVKLVSITHSEPNIWNGPIVATAIGNVKQDMLERVWREWEYRLDVCHVTRGAHIECI